MSRAHTYKNDIVYIFFIVTMNEKDRPRPWAVCVYQLSLSSFGMTSFMAVMAHSIMLSSGSSTVRC